jgi:ATP-binding cassette subfamily C exporter for protease/lipase
LAAQRVGFHEQILRLPQGYDTPLGPSGAALSGGQRQRVALARALYGDPVLVVLDEPNSNLDDAGEKALTDAIKDLSARGRTSVLITHRPTALTVTNRLMVLREGTIAAFGPREDVLAAIGARAGDQPAPARAPAAPPVLVAKAAAPAPKPVVKAQAQDEAQAESGMPPFNLKFND